MPTPQPCKWTVSAAQTEVFVASTPAVIIDKQGFKLKDDQNFKGPKLPAVANEVCDNYSRLPAVTSQ